MKKDLRSSKQIIKALSIGISATMLLQPISAFADEGTANAAGNLHTEGLKNDAPITDSTVAAEVKAAEEADKAAYEAEQAAEKATELAEELVEKVEGKDKTETEEAVDGILDKDNNGDELTLEENVEEAKEAVADANDAVDDLQADVDAALDVIAEEATNDVSANVAATETAYNNADKAEDAARLALETLSGNDSIVYKEDAMVEVNKAIEAANTADQEAKKAESALTEAEERYNKAVEDYEALLAQADVSRNEIEKSVSDNEYADAQDELAKAKAAVEAAKAEYDAALAKVGTAENNAKEAVKQAGVADENADAVVEYLTQIKGTESLETLKQNLANAQAKYDGEDLTEEQAQKLSDKYADNIATAQTTMSQESNKMNQASATINDWALNKVANSKTSDVKEVKQHYWIKEWISGWREVSEFEYYGRFLKFDKEIRYENICYTQTEIDAAKGVIAQAKLDYNAAHTAYENASSAKTTAENNKKITDEIVSAHKSLEIIDKYIYNNDADVTYADKTKVDDERYKALLEEAKTEYAQYEEVHNDLDRYHDAVDGYDGFWDFFKNFIKNKFTEWGIEAKYREWNWKVENDKETHVILAFNESNENFLITAKEGKYQITQVEEAEFATFSATFDAVAAAQAAEKAADAAEAEKEALKKYNAAVARLSTLQDEVDALQVKALTNDAVVDELDAAYRRLASAFAMVNQASQNYNDAKDEAKKAKEAADEAQKIADSKASRPTPAPSDDDDDDYVVPTVEEITPAPIQTVVLPQGGVTVAQTPVTVVDEATPQAAAPVTITEEAAPKAAAPEVAEAKEVIPEEEVPLAAADQSKMNWWWLLVVLVLGTTGAELYRRHMIKKNADSAKTTK